MFKYMLFDVPKEIQYHQFKKDLSRYGAVEKLTLIPDKKKPNVQFGMLNYNSLDKEEDLKEFAKSKKINLVVDKKNLHKSSAAPNNAVPLNTTRSLNIKIPNPSFYFYKDKKYGEGIEHFRLTDNYEELFSVSQAQTFELTTIYPGLLVGSGYSHPKLAQNKDDFQLGFFFDHTTGLPIISGSSIKGLLRSVIEKSDFTKEVYDKDVDTTVFEDQASIFYDAFIVSTKNEENKIFGTDFITNHYSNEKDGMFKEPNPIKFLKIFPNVTFRFQFKVDDKYLELFKEIIVDFGLGAKTNTGYGKFIVKKAQEQKTVIERPIINDKLAYGVKLIPKEYSLSDIAKETDTTVDAVLKFVKTTTLPIPKNLNIDSSLKEAQAKGLIKQMKAQR